VLSSTVRGRVYFSTDEDSFEVKTLSGTTFSSRISASITLTAGTEGGVTVTIGVAT